MIDIKYLEVYFDKHLEVWCRLANIPNILIQQVS